MIWWKRKQEEEVEETRRLVQHAAALHGVPTEEVIHAVLEEDDDVDEEEAPRRSRKGIWITLVVIGIVFGLGIVGLMKLANMSDQAGPLAVSGIQAMQKSIAPTPQINPTLSGTHIVFTYPAVFDVVTHPDNWSTTSERYALESKADYRKMIQVYVQNGSLATESGYMFRSQNVADYKANAVKVMGEPAVIMVKSDNSERTLYWAHAGHLVIMSATGEGNELPGYLAVIVASLRWVQ